MAIEVNDVSLSGLKLIQLPLFHDERGFFMERYNEIKFKELGLPHHFVQDNHSRTRPGFVRGLHYQYEPAQGKLVGCLKGRIWDVAVDLREDSPTRGKSYGVELTGENGKLLWIPQGFAHGFCVMGEEEADVLYKVDVPYNPKGEGGFHWADPSLGVHWPVEGLRAAPRDEQLPAFA